MIKKIYHKLKNKLFNHPNLPKHYLNDLNLFRTLDQRKRFELNNSDLFPCLNDKTEKTGFDAHYIYHPAWAARIVKQINPEKHIDISSTLHFCSIISAFIPTEFYDYRPADLKLSELMNGKADLTHLHFETGTIECISCMHTIEHIGLGRYGDPIDPDGDIKAILELIRVTKSGGSILFVTPVGKPKIMFNAHRIYDPAMIIDLFNGCEIKNFSLVKDDNDFILDAALELGSEQTYGCGCFWFIKK